MDNFEYALEKTLHWEGGYQNNANDPGNFNSAGENIGTNMGISAKTLEWYLGRRPDAGDMKSLTKEVAADIYKRLYWDAVKGDQIIDQDLAALIFDMAVNHGPSSAIRAAQRAAGVKSDGKIGPITLGALNRGSAAKLITNIVDGRVGLYQSIVKRRPQMKVFLRGWVKRAYSFLSK